MGAIGNLTAPIDIQSVNQAVYDHEDLLVTLDTQAAANVLQHFTPMSGITNSIMLGRTSVGAVSRKYTGTFQGEVSKGEIFPRELKVWACVMEMLDEPEKYRRAYITEVRGGLTTHPFEVWLINYGIKAASQDLHNVLCTAKRDESSSKTSIADSFNGYGTILDAERTAGEIAVAKGNMCNTGAFTRADIGDQLLEMYRKMPLTFRNKPNQKLHISADLGDLYDNWMEDHGVMVIGNGAESAGQKYLRNTANKLEIVRHTDFPQGSQFAFITDKSNAIYGYDSDSDFSSMRATDKEGGVYQFAAAGKYVFGMQFRSIDKSELMVNEQAVTPQVEGQAVTSEVEGQAVTSEDNEQGE